MSALTQPSLMQVPSPTHPTDYASIPHWQDSTALDKLHTPNPRWSLSQTWRGRCRDGDGGVRGREVVGVGCGINADDLKLKHIQPGHLNQLGHRTIQSF